MALARRLSLAVLLGLCTDHGVAGMKTMSSANPIRRVVNMLQRIQDKIKDEGEAEEKLFQKFMCYCKNGDADLQAAIKDAKTRIPRLQSEIQSMTAEKSQLGSGVVAAKGDREDEIRSMKKARSNRDRETRHFAADKAELETNINAFGEAIKVIQANLGGGGASSLLQTQTAARLEKVTRNANMNEVEREALLSFLSTGTTTGDVSAIIGILKQLQQELQAELKSLTQQEQVAAKDFKEMYGSLKKQTSALTKSLQHQTSRLGDVGSDLVNTDDDLDDTEKGLDQDTHFQRDLGMECATKEKEWEKRSKMRSDEQLALADTIKMLNDDDALDLFKKALPSASFLQVQVSSKDVRRRARQALGADRRRDPRLDFISLALRGKKANFDKVFGMIDDMLTLLDREQAADNRKKDYCLAELDSSDDKKKVLDKAKEEVETVIDETKEKVESLASEIKQTGESIQDLDQKVVQATANRKEEHANFEEEQAQSASAEKLLLKAKKKLSKFYKGASLVEVSSTRTEEGDASDGAPPPPPEAFGPYTKKGGGAAGVVGLLESLIGDLKAESAEAKIEEDDAQRSYERFVKDAAEKRSLDSSKLGSKESAKSETNDKLLGRKKDDKDTLKKIMGNDKYIVDLHSECDWLVKNHGVREKARGEERSSLKQAKTVLQGFGPDADVSLVQIGSTRRHRAFLA